MTTQAAPGGASWDFSKIPAYSSNRPTRPQVPCPFKTPPLAVTRPKLAVGLVDDLREHVSMDAKASSANGISRFDCDFSQIAVQGGRPPRDRAKLSEASPLTDEVTQPDAGVRPDGGALPPASSPDAGTPTRKAEFKSGPTYTPSGTIRATKSGGTKTATFKLGAEFKHEPAKGIYAASGEVRQYIKWTAAEASPRMGAFDPASAFPGDTWYEDRDPAGKRYGHRSGSYAECVSIDRYEDSAGANCADGAKFVGKDKPVAAESRTGKWSFELRAVDTASGTDIGTPASLAIDWNV